MKAIRNTQDNIILLVSDESIIKGYAHDTYGDYGQSTSSYEAGDWCFEQDDFLEVAKQAAIEKLGEFNSDDFNIDIIGDTEIDVYPEDDEEAKFYIDLYEDAEFSEWVGGFRTDHRDGFIIKESCWEGDFEIASIEKDDTSKL